MGAPSERNVVALPDHNARRTRQRRPLEPVQRVLWTRQEAANSLGISVDHFERHVQPFIKVVPSGQLVLVPPAEVKRWANENARYLVKTPR